MKLSVGVGREIITPEIGGCLLGYRPDVFSESVHDDLTVTALAFAYGNVKTVLISATVGVMNTALSDALRAEIGRIADIPPENVFLFATHTHSGPVLMDSAGWGNVDAAYRDKIFIPGCLKAAEKALSNVKPVRMGVNCGKSKTGINRRQILQNGDVVLGQNPWGLYDPWMTVISFRDEENKPFVNIVHYGAHCTAAGMNHEITRDWPGLMIDRMEKETGAVTAFFNGAIGDVGPRLSNGGTTGDINYVIEIGSLAALDAVNIYKGIKTFTEADCDIASDELCFPYDPMMPLAEAERELAKFKDTPPHNLELAKYTTLISIVEAHKNGQAGDDYYKFTQSIFRIGDVVFIPYPFETFSEISLKMRAYGKYQYMLTVNCSNGGYGYLPTRDQMAMGGYEVNYYKWTKPRKLPDDLDNRIINENLRIIGKLK